MGLFIFGLLGLGVVSRPRFRMRVRKNRFPHKANLQISKFKGASAKPAPFGYFQQRGIDIIGGSVSAHSVRVPASMDVRRRLCARSALAHVG